MKPYFEDKHNQEEFLKLLDTWKGVPYEHMGESKSGIDCSKLLGKLLLEMGILNGNLEKVYKAPDWYLSSKKEVLLEFVNLTLKEHLNKKDFYFMKIPTPNELRFGDFLFFAIASSGVCNHSAIYLGEERIFHCLTNRHCCYDQLNFSWKKRIAWAYRLMLW